MTIDELVKGGLAEQAGMKAGDVLISVAGVKTEDFQSLRKVLASGEQQRVVVWSHGGKQMTATFDWEKSAVIKAN